jgi:glycosyltransferase involved in cell wall biosynthesis
VRIRATAVVPALDEAPAVGSVVRALLAHDRIERVIVVDNGSTDGTGEVARAAGAEVVREERRGYGRACRAGLAAAAGADALVFLDADAADDPGDLDALLGPLERGEADLVVGRRVPGRAEPGATTARQRAGNRVAVLLARLLAGARLGDLGPFRAIRRTDLARLEMSEPTYGWSAEMAVKAVRAGLRYREVPVAYRRRIGTPKVATTPLATARVGASILSSIVRHARWRPATARGPR